jgi:hypothetical protein
MARISTYAAETNIVGQDRWIGSAWDTPDKTTKNFTADGVANYFNNSGSIFTGSFVWKYSTYSEINPQALGTFSLINDESSTVDITELEGILKFSNQTINSTQPGGFIEDQWIDQTILIYNAPSPSQYGLYKVNGVTSDASYFYLEVEFLAGRTGTISAEESITFDLFAAGASSSGTSGTSGTTGTSGTSGNTGSSGTTGTSGTSGITGTSGSSGVSGASGSSGTTGTSGSSGTGGTSGISGTNGTSGTTGTSGTDGSAGTSGVNGVSNNLFLYQADTGAQSGYPGNGHILWNNATQISATQINISHLTNNNIDIDIFLALLQDLQQITIQDQNNSANYQIWDINGTPTQVTGTNNYWTVPVVLISSAGTGSTNFANNHPLFLAIVSQSGTSGVNGTSGTGGTSGTTGTSGTDGSAGTSGIDGTSGTTGTSGTSGTGGTSGISPDPSLYVLKTGDTMTGGLVINPANTAVTGLDVASNTFTLRSDSTNPFARQLTTTMGSGTLVKTQAAGFGGTYVTDLGFYTSSNSSVNTTPNLYLTGGNNYVGINTDTPAYNLDVAGDVNVSGVFRVNGTPISSGGSSIMVLGTGCNSTIRCGVNNVACGDYSAALSGQCNNGIGNFSFIGGGSLNTNQGLSSFIGGGGCNTTTPTYSCSIVNFNNITCSNCYGGVVLDASYGDVTACFSSGTALTMCLTDNSTCNTISTGSSYYAGSTTFYPSISSYNYCAVDATVETGTKYATIGGGFCNTASSFFSTVGGGCLNTACGKNSFIGGGRSNTVSSDFSSVISGGDCNTICASAPNSTISGGYGNTVNAPQGFIGEGNNNTITGGGGGSFIGSGNCNTVCGSGQTIINGGNNLITGGFGSSIVFGSYNISCDSYLSTIVSGSDNCIINGCYATIINGSQNTIDGVSCEQFIGGGFSNKICNTRGSFIGTGFCNTICSNVAFQPSYPVIVGGFGNSISSASDSIDGSSIVGGVDNNILGTTGSACISFIGGGNCNRICDVGISSIVGGSSNTINCNGFGSFIGGGKSNSISGNYSAVLGGRGNSVSGNYSGAFGCNLNASAACTMYFNNVCVCGTLSKASGSFKIPHPDPIKSEQGKFLKHSFVESPTAGDNIYRFNVTAINCSASIQLPDYYSLLNSNDQVFVNAKSHLGYGFGVVNEAQTEIDITTNSDGEYNVLLIGTRKDKLALDAWNGTEVNDVE